MIILELLSTDRNVERGSDKFSRLRLVVPSTAPADSRGPTFLVRCEPDGSWLATPEGAISDRSGGRLVRGWNDINTLRREWRAQAHWSAADHDRFVAEFGDPRAP
jgi:hypothetical protein